MKEQPASTETALWDMQWLVIFSIDAENMLFRAYIALGIHNVKINSQHGQTTPVVSALKLWFYRHSAAKQKISGHLSARYVRCVFTMELDGVFFSIRGDSHVVRGEAQMEGKDAGDHSTESPCWELQETNSQNTHTKGKRQSKRPHLNGHIFSSRFVQKENIYSLLWHYLLWNFEYNESDLRLLSIKKAL